MKKTQKEIDSEISSLRKIKPNVKQFSAFGDNHYSIEAQITTLEEDLSEDDIYDRNEGAAEDEQFASDNEKDNAIYAIQWRNGDEEEAPSKCWESLLVK